MTTDTAGQPREALRPVLFEHWTTGPGHMEDEQAAETVEEWLWVLDDPLVRAAVRAVLAAEPSGPVALRRVTSTDQLEAEQRGQPIPFPPAEPGAPPADSPEREGLLTDLVVLVRLALLDGTDRAARLIGQIGNPTIRERLTTILAAADSAEAVAALASPDTGVAEGAGLDASDPRDVLAAAGVPSWAYSLHGSEGERLMSEGLRRLATPAPEEADHAG